MGKTRGEGMNAPRAYRNDQDLQAMQDLLIRGRQVAQPSYYIHVGDLKWWLYYPPLEGDFWDHIHLWDDPDNPARLLGWALISPDWVGFDVYVQPELCGSDLARSMYIWAEEQAMQFARQRSKPAIQVLWGSHEDDILAGHFRRRGFRVKRGYVHLTRDLAGPISPGKVPEGFVVRSCRGEVEVTARARAQYGAFSSLAAFADYEQRFRSFMRSPVYQPELDILAVAPDGQVGAFCIVWTDPVNKVGLFEPLGTHPHFRRQGLGTAVMLQGLLRLKERGMSRAVVSTPEDNLAGVRLYENVGFQVAFKLGTYQKDV
jgi:mycothiol synthase